MILHLTNGGTAEIDDDLPPEILNRPWRLWAKGIRKYVVRTRSKTDPPSPHLIKMHREIVGAPAGLDVDHIDGDGLNNKRDNLRVCTRAQNIRNSRKRRNTSSQYKGVYWHKKAGKWVAQLNTGVEMIYLGLFADEAEAARAYDVAVVTRYGAFARPNFPEAFT